MPSDKCCCVPGCMESGGMHRVLHQFPNPENERERYNTWLYAIGGDILGLENDHIFKYRRVCHSHFKEEYLCRNNRISNIAIPTLCLPGLSSLTQTTNTRQPLQLLPNPSPSTGLESRQPLQTLRQPLQMSDTPSTSTGVQHYGNSPFTTTPMDIEIGIQKENIDPNRSHDQQFEHATTTISVGALSKSQKTPLKKNVRRVKLSIIERDLHMKVVTAKRQISKLKNKIKKQSASLKAAKKMVSNPALLPALENSSTAAKLLLQIQGRENKKRGKGRRFTLKEKILALSIYKQSPKAYRFLRKIFILPAAQTLVKIIQQCNIKPGINKNVFLQLKKKADNMSAAEKLCVLLFDEMSLKANVTYNEKKDKITGVIDNGLERKPEFADHAQVFMVRGLIKNYKQPVFYSFSASATKGPELAKQIKMVITEIQNAGLTVLASVCDQGTNNRQAINMLINETRAIYLRRGETPKEQVILINNMEVIPLYDPPHLLKGIRNNLMVKDLKYSKDGQNKIAKWSHLMMLHKENPGYKGIRLIPKMTENHVNPEKMNKMKVKYASQIFSCTVASNMGYLADKGILPAECKDTADFLLFMDQIFDSVNGSYKKNKYSKPLLGPATAHSVHHNIWAEAQTVFSTMKFVSSLGKTETVPSITNWIWTLSGIKRLISRLHDYGVSSVWLRHLNQDPLENFFGGIRSHGCRNINPTCDQFESAYASLLINNLNSVHTLSKNCENDFCDVLFSYIINDSAQSTSTGSININNVLDMNFTSIPEKEKDPRVIAPLQYVSGYFLKKCKSNVFKNCSNCSATLSNKNEMEYIKYREYAGRRWLCTPSDELIKVISNYQDLVNEIIKYNFDSMYLKEAIKTAAMAMIDFDFINCDIHKNKIIEYLNNVVVRFLLFNYCKIINKILTGKRNVDDENDIHQMKAKKHQKKCFKRKI